MDNLLAKKGISLDRFRSFLAVADAGGMAKAAPGDPVRQSQLSRQIGELEAAFAVPLTERKGRSVALTPAGRQLAEVLRESFARLGEVATQARAAVPTLTLGAGDSLLNWRIIPALARLDTAISRPQLVLVALGSGEIVRRLEDGRLDLGLVRSSELPRGLRSTPVGFVQDVLFVPRRLLDKTDGSPGSILSGVPLALTHGEPGVVEHVETIARRLGVEPRIELLCETFVQACRAVKTLRYAALLPSIAADELRSSGVIQLSDAPLAGRSVRILLAWHTRLERRASASFVQTLSSAVRWDGSPRSA
jgi:DNA-binding transcriptional LysR family regulator